MTYTYDGDGQRVMKSNGTIYWGVGPLLESDLSGNLQREFIFAGGKRIARRDLPDGTVHYIFSDRLGSAAVVTTATGTIQRESDYYPYGGERVYNSGLPNQNYKFMGKERDSESGLDYFGARHDASSLGRFISLDAASARPTSPQSWNRYSYTLNNPLRFVDPNGLEAVDIALFWLTLWAPTGVVFNPGDMLAAFGSAVETNRPQQSGIITAKGEEIPTPQHGSTNYANNMAVADAGNGAMCPPFCGMQYSGRTAEYRLTADFKTNPADSSKSTVTLSEQIIPDTGSVSRPGCCKRFARWIDGPPKPEFKTDVLNGNIDKLSDKDLQALQGALFQATVNNPADEAAFLAYAEAIHEQGRRERKRKACLVQGTNPTQGTTQDCE